MKVATKTKTLTISLVAGVTKVRLKASLSTGQA